MITSGVPYDYIDSMTPKELFFTLNHLDWKVRNWEEKHRFLCYMIIQCQITKEISPADIYPLIWDKPDEVASLYDKNELEDLKARAKKIEEEMNHG